ncbi:M28 family peptidase [Pontibacter fetidus]|uniref:M28 family peptidase n=1 Tax=Pontibacter fetidus TaxID=2700082 RepID=A0A6B2H494_9BACT|nr:M28 family peptidase [Pontibacter fetidus]NDK56938.1 M28 family peptidase [Pontibacter fetidus]
MKHLHTYGFVLAALLASGCASTNSTTAKGPVTDAEKLRAAATTYGQTITAADLSKHLTILASDAYEGRNTGEKGQKMAAEYIAREFREDGLMGPVKAEGTSPYYQTFNLEKGTWGDGYVMVGNKKFTMMQDFFPMGSSIYTTEQSATPVFIADNAAIDTASLKGKMLVTMVTNLMEAEKKMNDLGQLARKAEAASVMYVLAPDAFTMMNQRYASRLRQASISLPGKTNSRRTTTFMASPALGAAILGTTPAKLSATATTYKPATDVKILTQRNTTPLPTENVLGFIEGSDKKDEVVLVTAHYDHVGIEQDAEGDDKIFNGANDDGSGTVAVIELAEAFAKAKQAGYGPRRSILFMTVTAEEKGLLGSEYYSENPVFPLANTVADVNIDMIGRMDFDYEKQNDSNYIYVIGSDKLSSELHKINEEANQKYTNLKLDYKYNDENDPNRFYYRSDHYNFAKHGIPIIFYFNGVHADYHKPSDSVDKILFDSAEKVARLAFYTTWELANRDNRIVVDSNKK